MIKRILSSNENTASLTCSITINICKVMNAEQDSIFMTEFFFQACR